MLVKPHEFFRGALDGAYALGAFNASNLELAQAIVAGAAVQSSPVIVQTSEGAIEYAGLAVLAALIKTLADQASVPVVLHLDHGKSLETVQRCIEAGYTSVMIDASDQEFAENMRITKEVVDYAHERGVWVEAELGTMLGAEGMHKLAGQAVPEKMMTDPTVAAEFAATTKIDALAVSIGTIHGAFTGQEYIRFELLDKIQQAVPGLPLVLHGASGIADEHLARAVKTNVCKVNVDTEMRLAFEQAVKAYFAIQHEKSDPREILGPAREAVQAVVESKIQLFGSSEKAATSN